MNLISVKAGELKEVFDALEEAFKEAGLDYYLIGAIGRENDFSFLAFKDPA
jgi:hypothetical protein